MSGLSVTEYNSIFGGLPGQTRFYFTAETLLACNGNKEKLWRSLQQPLGGPECTFWPAVREYRIKVDAPLNVAWAEAKVF